MGQQHRAGEDSTQTTCSAEAEEELRWAIRGNKDVINELKKQEFRVRKWDFAKFGT